MLLDAEARRRGGRRGERIFGMGASTEEEPKERGGSGEERATRNSAHFGVQHLADFGEQGVRGEWLVQEGNRRLPGLRPAGLVAIPGHVEDPVSYTHLRAHETRHD